MYPVTTPSTTTFEQFLPAELREAAFDQTLIPRIAKDEGLMARIESVLPNLPTSHTLHKGDARSMSFLAPNSVHLVVTSPPYWTLKAYEDVPGQLGHLQDYEAFLLELDKVWASCYEALVPGGRLVCVVGDVCLSRRKNKGVHMVMPLHASIQEHCRALGFTNLSPIIWHKIANAVYEAGGAGALLGKPYEPNAVIKNDIEFILMERKPGAYREKIPEALRMLSAISDRNHKQWFQQIWSGVSGASTRDHPAPYPVELAQRLIRMFSFVGDTVLDPFVGSGTTTLAAAQCGRNSVGVELVGGYLQTTGIRLARAFKSIPGARLSVG